MTHFRETDEGLKFINSGFVRETSDEIMQSIAFFARNLDEAELLWKGDGWGIVCSVSDFWENVTRNGLRDPEDFCWGASGTRWWAELQE